MEVKLLQKINKSKTIVKEFEGIAKSRLLELGEKISETPLSDPVEVLKFVQNAISSYEQYVCLCIILR